MKYPQIDLNIKEKQETEVPSDYAPPPKHDDIKNLNNLQTNTLAIGQTLKIPSKTGTNEQIENYSTYVVKTNKK